jgi:hypothetical protein
MPAARHFSRSPVRACGVFDHREQVEVQLLETELARFDLGKVENVIDDGHQRIRAGVNSLSVLPLLGGQFRVKQQPGHADDAVHRGANLVTHVGEKLRLQPR